MSWWLVLLTTVALAAANGANDNVKGAATLIGSGVVGYRAAISLATIATAIGGLASIFLVNGLLAAFSGKGVVPDALTISLPFLEAVGLGAAATVALATRLGMPISTTHALIGGLMGAGLAVDAASVQLLAALKAMLLPLLVSPLLAILLALLLVPLLKRRRPDSAEAAPCICLQPGLPEGAASATLAQSVFVLGVDSEPQCQPTPGRSIWKLQSAWLLDAAHLCSAAAVSFARGLNDTPKIAALMVAGGFGVASASTLVIVAMALGGWLAARRVADTLAFRVTRMDVGEGLSGNLVTALLVMGASRFGLPVSTTHVSTGALFGIGLGNHSTQPSVIRQILLAWLVTLPMAATLAFLARLLLN